MAAAMPLPDATWTAPTPDAAEPRILIHGMTFRDYVLLGDVLGHRPSLRLTYLEGTLEIMTTSSVREVWVYEGGRITVRRLEEGGYVVASHSMFFPDLDRRSAAGSPARRASARTSGRRRPGRASGGASRRPPD
jgi:hypothetical protein